MTARADVHERSLNFSEIALGQIRALRQPATPRSFEVWYAYATGDHPSLNQRINEALAAQGTLTDVDLDKISNTHLSPPLADRIDQVGSQVADEIEQVMAMIDAAAGTASNHTDSLVDMRERLGQSRSRESLRSIVEGLVQTAKEMESANKRLEESLQASRQEISELQESVEAIRIESVTDPLTGLANRTLFDAALHEAVLNARENNVPLALLMIDIDHFKKINDSHGHLTGDQVLRLVAMFVKQNVRGKGTAARYGGEEFAIILPNATLPSAVSLAEHIREAVMTKKITRRSTGEHLGKITISAGVALWHPGDTAGVLIERADVGLYAAKRQGRNRVIYETDQGAVPGQAAY